KAGPLPCPRQQRHFLLGPTRTHVLQPGVRVRGSAGRDFCHTFGQLHHTIECSPESGGLASRREDWPGVPGIAGRPVWYDVVRAIIERWRCEYNEERPKKALGGLTPPVYAKHLAEKSAAVRTGL